MKTISATATLLLTFALMTGCSSGPDPKFAVDVQSFDKSTALTTAQSVYVEPFALPAEFEGAVSAKHRTNWQTEWPKIGAERFAKGFSWENGSAKAFTDGQRDLTISVTVEKLNNGDGKVYFFGVKTTATMAAHVTIKDKDGTVIAAINANTDDKPGDDDGFPVLADRLGGKIKYWIERNRN